MNFHEKYKYFIIIIICRKKLLQLTLESINEQNIVY